VIYQQRNDIMDADNLAGQIASLREGCFTDLTRQYVPVESVEEQWDIAALEKVLRDECKLICRSLQNWSLPLPSLTTKWWTRSAAANAAFEAKVAAIGENFIQFERVVLLQSMTATGASI
jgi:preprotein translocase subunit SecA